MFRGTVVSISTDQLALKSDTARDPRSPGNDGGSTQRCRFSCRFTPTLSGIPKGEQRQITLSVNDLLISCRTSYSPSVA